MLLGIGEWWFSDKWVCVFFNFVICYTRADDVSGGAGNT